MVLIAGTTETLAGFWVAANLAGLCMGSSQAAGRAIVGYLAPPGAPRGVFRPVGPRGQGGQHLRTSDLRRDHVGIRRESSAWDLLHRRVLRRRPRPPQRDRHRTRPPPGAFGRINCIALPAMRRIAILVAAALLIADAGAEGLYSDLFEPGSLSIESVVGMEIVAPGVSSLGPSEKSCSTALPATSWPSPWTPAARPTRSSRWYRPKAGSARLPNRCSSPPRPELRACGRRRAPQARPAGSSSICAKVACCVLSRRQRAVCAVANWQPPPVARHVRDKVLPARDDRVAGHLVLE